MNSIFEIQSQIRFLKATGDNDSFGVFYQSQSNPKNAYYLVVRNNAEFNNLKSFHREYDYIFNKLEV
jgi:hypothetical protein